VTRLFRKLSFPALIALYCAGGNISGQAIDYKTVFGNNWIKAEKIISENEIWMRDVTSKYGISYPLAISVIFPELIRYSALRDKMEITMLKTLYINLGDEYADFSVGQFQMKPSFAEDINEKAWSLKERKIRLLFKRSSSFDNIRSYRSSIVSDLEDIKHQLSYLVAFIRICENEYPVEKMSEEEKVKFLASAYNCGLNRSEEYIRAISGKRFFSTSPVKSETYSYADISLYWYRNNK
jgi:hypothetical protein